MLLADNVDFSDRKLCALIIKVEERELLQDTVALLNSWLEKLEKEGMNYTTPDAK